MSSFLITLEMPVHEVHELCTPGSVNFDRTMPKETGICAKIADKMHKWTDILWGICSFFFTLLTKNLNMGITFGQKYPTDCTMHNIFPIFFVNVCILGMSQFVNIYKRGIFENNPTFLIDVSQIA